ncbi:hypothetical protein BA6E_125571 [Bacteroidales bacterium 6E]|jgi:hypothetical protein|nr:hypothetical protein BA6E_125571 [Bacteroidales bacterium 6E]
MADREIALLKEQIERLNEPRFDLEAWKNQTVIFLERIFGKESTKVRLIRDLHYDYSSWSLRDTTGAGQSKDPVKFQARSILQATIEEIEKMGLPDEQPEADKLMELLREELTGRQIKEIETIKNSEASDRPERLADILETLEKENLSRMLARLLLA